MPGIELCAGAVVLDDAGRLLVVQRANEPGRGLWTVPGGRCLADETASEACAREVGEETGLLVRVVGEVGRVERDGVDGVVYDITDFRCEVVGGELRAGDDALDARWVDRRAFEQLALVRGLAEFLAEHDLLPR